VTHVSLKMPVVQVGGLNGLTCRPLTTSVTLNSNAFSFHPKPPNAVRTVVRIENVVNPVRQPPMGTDRGLMTVPATMTLRRGPRNCATEMVGALWKQIPQT
jgi:hypothetical protein